LEEAVEALLLAPLELVGVQVVEADMLEVQIQEEPEPQDKVVMGEMVIMLQVLLMLQGVVVALVLLDKMDKLL
jgi:hypothetical protein